MVRARTILFVGVLSVFGCEPKRITLDGKVQEELYVGGMFGLSIDEVQTLPGAELILRSRAARDKRDGVIVAVVSLCMAGCGAGALVLLLRGNKRSARVRNSLDRERRNRALVNGGPTDSGDSPGQIAG